MKHKVVLKRNPWSSLTNEMLNWLLERNPSLKDTDMELHNPLLVQCVEELKPDNFRIIEIEGNEYVTLDTDNDVVLLTPADIEIIKQNFVKIDEQE